MASRGQGTTKPGSLTTEFSRKAAGDPQGALATMFLAAFGVDLATLISIAVKMITTNDLASLMMVFTAGVQIRAHVVFVGRDYADIRNKYPELIIEGDRQTRDIYNFGALHALGHVIAHIGKHAYAKKVLAKAGSCITGYGNTDNEAGQINAEIAANWTTEDKNGFSNWLAAEGPALEPAVNSFCVNIPALSERFKKGPAATAGGKGGKP